MGIGAGMSATDIGVETDVRHAKLDCESLRQTQQFPRSSLDNTRSIVTAYSDSDDSGLPDGITTASGAPWVMRPVISDDLQALAAKDGVSRLLAGVLAGRGIGPDVADTFLNPSLRNEMPDPSILKDMDKMAERLAQAVSNGETIGIFGDYDVDGTCASAILKLYLDRLGAASLIHLPDRITEGYGPSIEAFQTLKSNGARIIVTVDCGAAAHDPVNAISNDGVDVLIVDHHQMIDAGPEKAFAVVNPQRRDDHSKLHGLSASALAFLTVAALNRTLRKDGWFSNTKEPDLKAYLDLAALGLVCDVMPMKGLARVIVAQGLKIMNARENGPGTPGLWALADAAGAKSPFSSYTLGFQIGPRINAAGRIGHARQAFELMTTNDNARRLALADELHEINARRQEIEADVQHEAEITITQNKTSGASETTSTSVAIAAGEGWHPGVVGIVAGRLKDKLRKPVFVIGLQDGIGKGSGRSLSGVDLGAACVAAREAGILISGGGHEMAAGITIAQEKLDAFQIFLDAQLGRHIKRAQARRIIDVDGIINAAAVNRRLVDDTARAGPFGPSNPEPVFVLKDMTVLSTKPVGVGHLAITLLSPTGQNVRSIAFRVVGDPLGDLLSTASRLHLAGKIKADDWRGGDAAQFQIIDAAQA